jgi:hypothetical protein
MPAIDGAPFGRAFQHRQRVAEPRGHAQEAELIRRHIGSHELLGTFRRGVKHILVVRQRRLHELREIYESITADDAFGRRANVIASSPAPTSSVVTGSGTAAGSP